MPSSVRMLATVGALASMLVLSCSKQPPKEPETEPDPFANMEEPPSPPAAPEPSCATLEDGCKAEADTTIAIGEGAQFQPPEGWVYAERDVVTVAQTEDGAAGLAYRILSALPDPKGDAAGVIEAMAPVFESLSAEVGDAAIKKQLGKDGVVDDKGALELSTWQLEGTVGGKDGVIILVVSSLDSGQGLVGAVALQKDAVKDNLEAVQSAYRSVRSSQ